MRRSAFGFSRVLILAVAATLSVAQLIVSSGSARAAVGDITEYAAPTASVPESIASGPDGNLWFAEFLNKVAKVTTSGVFTEYTVPSTSSPFGMAAGPDGNLWFTEQNGDRVAKLTTSGGFTEYPVPTTSSAPSGIAAGPDGNLWFTEQFGNKVAKVTTSGAVTEYSVPTASSEPWLITAGPDGNLWFTELAANKVANVTMSGVVTEYSVPTAGSRPTGIAAGPDGNLWFTEFNGQKVAKVTPSGVITEFPIPTAGGGPNVITAGPDGNLWFIEASANKVAQVTTSGVITEYPIPTGNSWPMGIAAGPDGNIWFAEHNANKVAKVIAAAGPVVRSTYKPGGSLRVLDTRTSGQSLADGGSLNLQLGTSVPSNATAVLMNVTVTNTFDPGFLTIYPAGALPPVVSSLNWTTDQTVANLVQVGLGIGSAVTMVNSPGAVPPGFRQAPIDVVVDLEGYYSPSTGFSNGELVPLPPYRITDTRPGSGFPNAGLTLGEGTSLDVQVTGAGGVPAAGIEAVVLNATVTNTTAAGFLTAYGKGASVPLASNLNWLPGTTVPNRVVVELGAGGMVSFFNSSGTTDLVVDVNGYFTDSTAGGGSFVPLTPARILDTRDGTGGFSSPLGQGAFIPATVAGQGTVPLMSSATPPSAVVLNVTATNPTAAGFLTVWPDLLAQPPASDLNFLAGQSVPNLVIVKVGANGKVDVYNGWGSTDVIFDVVGWYG